MTTKRIPTFMPIEGPQVEDEEWNLRVRNEFKELQALPAEWEFRIIEGEDRLYYVRQTSKGIQTEKHHPTLGPLPGAWIVRMCEMDGVWVARYYDRERRIATRNNPRHDPEVVKSRNDALQQLAQEGMAVAGSYRKLSKGSKLRDYQRQEIGCGDIRHLYEQVRILDAGDGTLGAMNGGVFVVKLKGQDRLSVEKRFKSSLKLAVQEITILHRVQHPSISMYTAGFIIPENTASVYVELCDKGSMEDLFKTYALRRLEAKENGQQAPYIPERFIWHAFLGLCDGLAYLRGGKEYSKLKSKDTSPAKGWAPILHRDLKPDNVLFRSRETLGSNKYPYCVISDFGLACEDWNDNHPNVDMHQKNRIRLGTCNYFAPELCYSEFPDLANMNLPEARFFPNGNKHTEKSDLWALGASIYNIAQCEAQYQNGDPISESWAHICADAKPGDTRTWEEFFNGKKSRKQVLPIKSRYSKQLGKAIHLATQWDPKNRPTCAQMVFKMQDLMKEAGMDKMTDDDRDALPQWALRAHDFYAKNKPKGEKKR